jgi:hypothetical protein
MTALPLVSFSDTGPSAHLSAPIFLTGSFIYGFLTDRLGIVYAWDENPACKNPNEMMVLTPHHPNINQYLQWVYG